MVDFIDEGLALGDESSDDERDGSAQIGGDDLAAFEGRGALDVSGFAIGRADLRAEFLEFFDVLEAIFKDIFGDERGSLCLGHKGHELRLEIGGEAGVGRGGDVDGFDFCVWIA